FFVAALPPLFFKEEPPSTVLFLNSSGAVVPCSAGGVPTPSTAWRKADGGPVLTDLPGLRQLRSDGSLVFPPFGADQYRPDVHATSYRCEASNSYGSIGSRDVRVSAGTCRLLDHAEGNVYISRKTSGTQLVDYPTHRDDYLPILWLPADNFTGTPRLPLRRHYARDPEDDVRVERWQKPGSFSFFKIKTRVSRQNLFSVNTGCCGELTRDSRIYSQLTQSHL
ncbi:unnamed protein product, partial [Ixodes persulcatus]